MKTFFISFLILFFSVDSFSEELKFILSPLANYQSGSNIDTFDGQGFGYGILGGYIKNKWLIGGSYLISNLDHMDTSSSRKSRLTQKSSTLFSSYNFWQDKYIYTGLILSASSDIKNSDSLSSSELRRGVGYKLGIAFIKKFFLVIIEYKSIEWRTEGSISYEENAPNGHYYSLQIGFPLIF